VQAGIVGPFIEGEKNNRGRQGGFTYETKGRAGDAPLTLFRKVKTQALVKGVGKVASASDEMKARGGVTRVVKKKQKVGPKV